MSDWKQALVPQASAQANLLPCRIPLISFDVLAILFELLNEPSDVIALMRTCKMLYAAGARHLLQFKFSIKSDHALVSFGLFVLYGILEDAPLSSLQKLEVAIPPLQVDFDGPSTGRDIESQTNPDLSQKKLEGMPTLIKILRNAPQLSALYIYEAEKLLKRGEGTELLDAILGLQPLRSLLIHSLGVRTMSLLRKISAPLTEINISCLPPHPIDIIYLLFPFRDTLKVATIWWAKFWPLSPPRDLTKTPQFSRIRALSIRGWRDSCDLALLLHIFPAIAYLEVTDWIDCHSVNIDEEHEMNMGVPVAGHWGSLRHVCGDLATLYALGLGKPVERLDIANVYLTWWAADQLDKVLAGLRPKKLLMHVGYSLGPCGDIKHVAAVLPQVLAWRDEVKQNITHFALDIKDCFAFQFLKDFFAALIELMNALPALKFFLLRIKPNALAKTTEEDVREKKDSQYDQSALEQRWLQAVCTLQEVSPTLEFVGLEMAWTISRLYARAEAGVHGCHSIDPERAAEVIKAEDMEWYRREPLVCPPLA